MLCTALQLVEMSFGPFSLVTTRTTRPGQNRDLFVGQSVMRVRTRIVEIVFLIPNHLHATIVHVQKKKKQKQ